jgi:phosphomevalonate kinase
MTPTFVARAPGKLFLAGEYAVLDGAPAVVAAVDRHVEVRLTLRPGERLTRIHAPGHSEPLDFASERFEDAPPELRFAVAAIDEGRRRLPELGEGGLDLEIHSGLEGGATAGQKIGLGGSAAVSTAIAAALFAAARGGAAGSPDEVFATAFTAHRSAQSGIGSGADVAASVYGGLLLFEPRPEALPRVTKLTGPPETELLVAWSGRSAATGPLVRHYLGLERGSRPRSAGEAGGPRDLFVAASRSSVAAIAAGLRAGRVDVRAVNDNGETLERLGRDAGLPLLTPDLERIVSIARAAGAGAKISGAGGGDCAIALTADPRIAARVRAAWRDVGIVVLDLHLEAGGVSVGKA